MFLLTLAGRAGAAGVESPPRQALDWLSLCLRDNPAFTVKSSLGISAERWDQACHDLQEPCLEIDSPEDQAQVPRCLRLCGEQYEGRTPNPEALKDCFFRSRYLPPPARPRVSRRLSRYDRVAAIIHGFIDDAVAAGRTADGLPARASREAVCGAYTSAQYRRQSDPDISLRDAEHYLFSYCHVAQRDSGVFRWPSGVAWCGIVYGYTFTKVVFDATLTDPYMGPGRNLLAAGEQSVSEPSLDEVRWGCWGAGDAARHELLGDPRRRARAPPRP